jgi:hypothetical protein
MFICYAVTAAMQLLLLAPLFNSQVAGAGKARRGRPVGLLPRC